MNTDQTAEKNWLKYHISTITGNNVRNERQRQARAICKSLDITEEQFNKIIDYIKKYT